jgi:hypothetical protein
MFHAVGAGHARDLMFSRIGRGHGPLLQGDAAPLHEDADRDRHTTSMCSAAIFACQICGPVVCTDSPRASTATVTGMSFTSNS